MEYHPETPIAQLKPYKNNARTHSDEQVRKISESITEFGFTNPVLIDSEKNILAGHGRLMAARLLGMKAVPTITLGHLTPTQRKALIIADNRLALDAQWDFQTLHDEILDLKDEEFNIDVLGFDSDELDDILEGGNFGAGGEDEQGKLDHMEPKMVVCPQCKHEFDAKKHAKD